MKKRFLSALMCATLVLSEISAFSLTSLAEEIPESDVFSASAVPSSAADTNTSEEDASEDELTGEMQTGTVDGVFAGALQKAILSVDANMSEFDKLLSVHDYLVSHISYDCDNAADTAYDALVDGITCSYGYSSAYSYILSVLGMENALTESSKMGQQWNTVKIGKKWYQTDITWDDETMTHPYSTGIKTEKYPGGASKQYFLESDSYFSTDHYGYDKTYTCSDSTYQTYYMKSITSPIIRVGSSKYVYSYRNALYVTANPAVAGTKLDSTVTSTSPRTNILFLKGGLFYYADKNNLYSYDLSSDTVTTVYTSSASNGIWGVKETDEGFTVIEDTSYSLAEVPISITPSYSEDIPITDVTLIQVDAAAKLKAGSTVLLSAMVTPVNTTMDKTPVWSSDNTSVATVDNGYVSVVGSGYARITVTAGGRSDYFDIDSTVPLTSVSVDPESCTIMKGNTFQLTASYLPTDTSEDTTVLWATSNRDVAIVDENGLVTGVKTGVADITATIGDFSAVCNVTVTERHISSAAMSDKLLHLYIGGYKQISCSYSPTNTTDDTTVTWSSGDTAIATVKDGLVVGKSVGSTYIYATIASKTVKCLVYVQSPQLRKPFTDLNVNAYYYDPVIWAYMKGIATGTTSTTFCPDNPCTRAQIVTFLWRLEGSPAPSSYESPFTDVQDQLIYYYDAVMWAVENNITSGTSLTTFSPDATCTRAQALTFLYRIAGEPPSGAEIRFQDVDPGSYYYDAVRWAYENGITSGLNKITFAPGRNCTRGQIATFLYRAN